MAILATLKKESGGDWPLLADYLRAVRTRDTAAVAALSAALSAPPEEQRELAQGEGGPVLYDIARDLRVPKGSRIAAVRCLFEGGARGPELGELFVGAGDLLTDPRMGGAARKLVELGLEAAALSPEPSRVSLAAGVFARALVAAQSAVGKEKLAEMLEGAPAAHAGMNAFRFANGEQELPAAELELWKTLLEETSAKHRRAPAAARRMGLAPPWPPMLPDAFAPLVKEAEEKTASITSVDAAKNPSALKPAAAAPAATPQRPATPEMAVARSPEQKPLAPPIRKSPFRKSIGGVVEVPARLPPKTMEAVNPRGAAAAAQETPDAPRVAPLEGLQALPSRRTVDERLDPRGRRIPRADRWHDEGFEWETPTLPSSEMPPPLRARVAPGPFTQRMLSLFEDRPEAVERLCAAAEARAAVKGDAALEQELAAELGRKAWSGRPAPAGQLRRLHDVAGSASQPEVWRRVARLVLSHLGENDEEGAAHAARDRGTAGGHGP